MQRVVPWLSALEDHADEEADTECSEERLERLLPREFFSLRREIFRVGAGFGPGLVSILTELVGGLFGALLDLRGAMFRGLAELLGFRGAFIALALAAAIGSVPDNGEP